MFLDENGKPKRVFGKVEWPIALLFSAVPALVAVAVVKNVILA